MQNKLDYLFIFTLTFFILGFFNIIFALFGFLCLILPFVFLFKDKKQSWCQRFCPRSKLFLFLFRGKHNTRAVPYWLSKGNGKWIFLAYFCINLLIITMSTLRVSAGAMEPVEQVRFMILFPVMWDIPQLLDFPPVPNWLLHLSYRAYSMMLTTTIFGLIFGWLYLARSWCSVCPVNTLSELALRKKNNAPVSNLSLK